MNAQLPTSNAQLSSDAAECRFDLEDRLLGYAADILRLCGQFNDAHGASYVASQLMRSGTSPLPNHGEAEAAQSKRDFVHKISICLKELRESRRWLRLSILVPLVKDRKSAEVLLDETNQLIRIFFSSIRTANSHPTKTSLDIGSSKLEVGSSKLDVQSRRSDIGSSYVSGGPPK